MRKLCVEVRDTVRDSYIDRIENVIGVPVGATTDDGAGNMTLYFYPPRYMSVRQRRRLARTVHQVTHRFVKWNTYNYDEFVYHVVNLCHDNEWIKNKWLGNNSINTTKTYPFFERWDIPGAVANAVRETRFDQYRFFLV